jgi:hypothetical protein
MFPEFRVKLHFNIPDINVQAQIVLPVHRVYLHGIIFRNIGGRMGF